MFSEKSHDVIRYAGLGLILSIALAACSPSSEKNQPAVDFQAITPDHPSVIESPKTQSSPESISNSQKLKLIESSKALKAKYLTNFTQHLVAYQEETHSMIIELRPISSLVNLNENDTAIYQNQLDAFIKKCDSYGIRATSSFVPKTDKKGSVDSYFIFFQVADSNILNDDLSELLEVGEKLK